MIAEMEKLFQTGTLNTEVVILSIRAKGITHQADSYDQLEDQSKEKLEGKENW